MEGLGTPGVNKARRTLSNHRMVLVQLDVWVGGGRGVGKGEGDGTLQELKLKLIAMKGVAAPFFPQNCHVPS